MLQISNLRLEVGDGPEVLRRKAAKALGIPLGELLELSLTRQSIDARKKQDVHLVCSVKVKVKEDGAILRREPKHIVPLEERPYILPPVGRAFPHPPVVVGMDRPDCSPLSPWPGRGCPPSYWNGAGTWTSGPPM